LGRLAIISFEIVTKPADVLREEIVDLLKKHGATE